MKALSCLIIGLVVLNLFGIGLSAESRADISCGQTIMEDTILHEDLACPPGTESAIVFGASNITLDLGGHVLSGYAPGTGVFALDHEGITIKNGTIEGFNDGIFMINARNSTIENLTIKNQNIIDPDHLIFGIHIDSSQDIVIRNMLFEFPSVPHKEAIDIFNSDVAVSDIEVQGGGSGVNFSFAGVCDPVNDPSNGTVLNSKFSNIYVAAILVACSSNAWIEGNNISTASDAGIGIQGDAPFFGAVTGLTIKKNSIHDAIIGIEFRGISESIISNNYVFDNMLWGIAMRPSVGCLTPELGWDCFYSTKNVIADNQTWGNNPDLYHHADSLKNIWERNTCELKDGVEIPECTPPTAALVINYSSGRPGSFFTLEGANFPANSRETIVANGQKLGTVPTDSSGDLLFVLNTEQADKGDYILAASENSSAPVKFVLDSSKPVRQQEGNGTVINLPRGLIAHFVYLPVVLQ